MTAPRRAPYVSLRRARRRVFYFGREEPLHLLAGALLVVVAGMSLFLTRWLFFYDVFVTGGLIAVFILAFMLHELAHKFVAQLYGLWAEFRTDLSFVAITLLSAVLPIKILAPGAVMISGPVTTELGGKIALAGPLTNALMAMTIHVLASVTPFHWLMSGAMINALLAFFNLLPLFLLDGQKVFAWDRVVWGLAFAASSALLLSTYAYGAFRLLLISLSGLCLVLTAHRALTVRRPRYLGYEAPWTRSP